MTVTTSPKKGLEPTLALSERLASAGYAVVPHLAARHVRDVRRARGDRRARSCHGRERRARAGRRRRGAGGRVRRVARAAARARRARQSVPRGRHRGLSGEPLVHLRRRDHPLDVRQGGARDVHRQPDLLRPGGDRALGRRRLGARHAARDPHRPARGGSSPAARAGVRSHRRRRVAAGSWTAATETSTRPRWSPVSTPRCDVRCATSRASISSRSTIWRPPSAGAAACRPPTRPEA